MSDLWREGDAPEPHPDALTPEDWDDLFACTHCGGEGICYDGADPLGNCPGTVHRCHACNGSGNREDQRIF